MLNIQLSFFLSSLVPLYHWSFLSSYPLLQVKGHNILLTEDGNVKLVDFGTYYTHSSFVATLRLHFLFTSFAVCLVYTTFLSLFNFFFFSLSSLTCSAPFSCDRETRHLIPFFFIISISEPGVSSHLANTLAKRNTSVGTPYWMAPVSLSYFSSFLSSLSLS